MARRLLSWKASFYFRKSITMHTKIKLLSTDEIFLGIRFSITKLVTDLKSYNPDKEYPRAYALDIGFIFGSIEFTIKGS